MAEAVRCGAEVYAALGELIVARFRSAGVGDEGGFAPDITITDPGASEPPPRSSWPPPR
jgi:enolase